MCVHVRVKNAKVESSLKEAKMFPNKFKLKQIGSTKSNYVPDVSSTESSFSQ